MKGVYARLRGSWTRVNGLAACYDDIRVSPAKLEPTDPALFFESVIAGQRTTGGREMANRDLRDWIEGVRAAGELKVITGAEPKEEIGGIVDIYMRKMGNPAVLFDEVPGFPKDHRVIANILTSIPRVNLALGLPPETA